MSDVYSVLVVGDVMFDRYTVISTSRNAPEAKIPVWDEIETFTRLGGAANVANNVKSILGDQADVFLAGIVGSGNDGSPLISGHKIRTELCLGGKPMVKHRFVGPDRRSLLFRTDNIRRFRQKDIDFFSMMSKGFIYEKKFDLVIFSDYDKGTVTEDIYSVYRDHPLVIVDSKREDLRLFRGCKVMKLNEYEYSAQVSSKLYPCFEMMFENCVVTKGPRGAELRQCETGVSTERRYVVHSEVFPVDPVQVVDVTGCGDTHTAAMAVSLLKDSDIRAAVRFANKKATEVVQKFGTSV